MFVSKCEWIPKYVQGMFEKNKYSGYVLKPEYLQRPDTFINPFTATGTPIFNYKVTVCYAKMCS